MASTRRLWTGAHGSALRDQLLDSATIDSASLWIVPSSLAAQQIRRILGTRTRGPAPPLRVFCWSDLWRSIGESLGDGPIRLSTTASDNVFQEAIRVGRETGDLSALGSVLDWPGYRRQLQARFTVWTRDEDLGTPVDVERDPVATAERGLFDHYRELLTSLKAEDDAGFAVWASRRILKRPPEPFAAFHQVAFLDWASASPAQWRFMKHALARAKSVHVSLAYEHDAASLSIYEASQTVRAQLIELGFIETIVPTDLWRPAGLRDVEQALFRPREHSERVSATRGLEVRGAPQGDGVARLIAHELKTLLDGGAEPDQILVLFRHEGEQSDRAFEIARDWGLPVRSTTSLSLTRDPSITALLIASSLPTSDWETTQLIRLLRHGQFRPDWPKAGRLEFAAAASLLQKTRVYRGRSNILDALDRAVVAAESERDQHRAGSARGARALVHRLISLLEPLDQPRPWPDQVQQLMRMVAALGLGEAGHFAIELLRDALDDTSDVLDKFGHRAEAWSWSKFVDELRAIVLRASPAPGPPVSGSILFATIEEAAGARVPFIIFADLAEGSFPSRSAVEPFLALRPGERPGLACRLAASREMLRFLRVLGSAESRITLVHPTTDAKGQELLRAGYLDDLLDLLTPDARAVCHQSIVRFDASLIDTPDLAGSPSDRRVRSVRLFRDRAAR
jgi:ATP-dependent helicase/nuclease subunit B